MTQAPRSHSPIFEVYFKEASIATEKALNVLLPDVVAKAPYVDARHVRGGRGPRGLTVGRRTARQKPRHGCGDGKTPDTRLPRQRWPNPATQWCARAPVLRYKGGRAGRGPACYVSAQHVPPAPFRDGARGSRQTCGSAACEASRKSSFTLTDSSPRVFVSVASRRPDATLSPASYLPKTSPWVTFSGLALGRPARESPLFIGSRRCPTRSLWPGDWFFKTRLRIRTKDWFPLGGWSGGSGGRGNVVI